MTDTLDGTDLQNIQSQQNKIRAELEKVKYPLSTTKEVEIYDYQGVDRVITIKGTATFSTKASLMDDFVVKMEGLMNGDQDTVVLHLDLIDESTSGDYQDGKFNVKVDDFDWTYVAGSALTVSYTLVLFEGN